MPRTFHPVHVGAGIGEPVGKHKQAQARQYGRGSKVAKALQKENSKHAGDRQAVLARQQQWPDGFPGTPQNKNGRKTHERPGVGVSETGWTHVPAETLPANRPDRITPVNRHDREQKQPDVGISNADDELTPGEIG